MGHRGSCCDVCGRPVGQLAAERFHGQPAEAAPEAADREGWRTDAVGILNTKCLQETSYFKYQLSLAH